MIRRAKRLIMPEVSWSSTTDLVVSPVVSDVQMNNGTWLSFDGGTALVMNTGVTGLGGVDSGGITTSAWHSLYLVPDGKYVDVVGSQADGRTAGPTGYSVYRYIGSFLTDGSSNLVHTYQHGNRVSTCDHFHTGIVFTLVNQLFGGTADTWAQRGDFDTNETTHQRRGRMDINWGLDLDVDNGTSLMGTTGDGVPSVAPDGPEYNNLIVGMNMFTYGRGARAGSFTCSRMPDDDDFYMARGSVNATLDMQINVESCEDRYLE